MKDQTNEKAFNVKMSYDLWLFLKKYAADEDISMNRIIINLLTKLRSDKKKVDTKR